MARRRLNRQERKQAINKRKLRQDKRTGSGIVLRALEDKRQ